MFLHLATRANCMFRLSVGVLNCHVMFKVWFDRWVNPWKYLCLLKKQNKINLRQCLLFQFRVLIFSPFCGGETEANVSYCCNRRRVKLFSSIMPLKCALCMTKHLKSWPSSGLTRETLRRFCTEGDIPQFVELKEELLFWFLFTAGNRNRLFLRTKDFRIPSFEERIMKFNITSGLELKYVTSKRPLLAVHCIIYTSIGALDSRQTHRPGHFLLCLYFTLGQTETQMQMMRF